MKSRRPIAWVTHSTRSFQSQNRIPRFGVSGISTLVQAQHLLRSAPYAICDFWTVSVSWQRFGGPLGLRSFCQTESIAFIDFVSTSELQHAVKSRKMQAWEEHRQKIAGMAPKTGSGNHE